MTGEKKPYFRERTVAEIKKLHMTSVDHQRDLVERIEGLDISEEALVVTGVQIIPRNFFYQGRRLLTGEEASRKCRKHGYLIPLKQPRTLSSTYESHSIPLDMRVEALGRIRRIKQQNLAFVGISWWPVFGNDKMKRVVNFDIIPRGTRRFSYAEKYSTYSENDGTGRLGIKVSSYSDAQRVRKEGATAVVEVPAESEKTPRYRFGLMYVPWIPNNPDRETNYNLATVLSLKPAIIRDEISDETLVGRTPHDTYSNIQYQFVESKEDSAILRYSPLDVAGFLGVVKKQLTDEHNMTALMYNPFPLPSKHQAEFYLKLCNNVLIHDASLQSKDQLRHLHLAEKSILLGRAIAHFGHDDFAYWNPTRDGIFKDYTWSI